MKNYPHIISRLLYEPLLILPKKWFVYCNVIESALSGNGFKLQFPEEKTPEEPDEDDSMVVQSTQIIPIHGTIARHSDSFMSGGCGLDLVHQKMDLAEYDTNVNRVLFDFRTPGGEVTGIPELADRIASFPKKTIGYTESECCSAGMWLLSQCDKAYASKSATLGSIGVWTAYLDYSKQMEKDGVQMQAIFAGKYKLLGAYWKPLTEEETAIVQAGVDKIYAQFRSAVNAIRPVNEDDMGNGLCFDGEEAAERGMTDGVVSRIEDIIESD